MADVMLRDLPSWHQPRACEYCGRGEAVFVIIPEPTERGTYSESWRQLCASCQDTYRAVPYGFALER